MKETRMRVSGPEGFTSLVEAQPLPPFSPRQQTTLSMPGLNLSSARPEELALHPPTPQTALSNAEYLPGQANHS